MLSIIPFFWFSFLFLSHRNYKHFIHKTSAKSFRPSAPLLLAKLVDYTHVHKEMCVNTGATRVQWTFVLFLPSEKRSLWRPTDIVQDHSERPHISHLNLSIRAILHLNFHVAHTQSLSQIVVLFSLFFYSSDSFWSFYTNTPFILRGE